MVNLKNKIIFFQSAAAKNIYISLFYKILTSVLFLVLVPYSIRTMGAEKYGIAAFFLTMHGYVSLLDSGFTYALGLQYTRRLTKDAEVAKVILTSALPIYLVLMAIALLGFFLFKEKLSQLAFGSEMYATHMMVFGLILALTALDSFLSAVLQAHEKINIIATGRFLLDLVKIIGVTMMAFYQMNPGWMIFFILTSVLVKIVFDGVYFKKLVPALKLIVDRLEVKHMLKLAVPSFLIAFCSLFMSMMDKFLVSGQLSSAAFTKYSFAFDLTTKAYFLMYAVTSVVYPKMVKSQHLSGSAERLIKIQMASVLFIAGIYYLPLSFFSTPITQYLLGAEFIHPTSELIKLCSVAALFYMTFSIFENYLNTKGSVVKTLMVYVVGLIAFILILSPLIEKYQIFGAVFAVIIMFLTMNLTAAALIFLRKT